jgi:uncharacterized YccA/Bax inhibitor family protein
MANPALAPKRLEATAEELAPGWATATHAHLGGTAGGGPTVAAPPSFPVMTANGAFAKTFVLWMLIVAGGVFGWSQVEVETIGGSQVGNVEVPAVMWIGMLVGFALAMVTIFVPRIARFTAPLYAIAMGVALGAISHVYDIQWEGIALQAVLATLATFAVCLALYVSGAVRVTQKFRFVVIAATLGIFLMYLVSFVLDLFGVDMQFWREPSALGIAVSVGICIVAALNLFLDFDMVRQLTVAEAPKQMEWYAAFGITVTVVWLYLEILRLLSYLRN